MIEARIKNLSIALEALRRIDGRNYSESRIADSVCELLDKAVDAAKNWPPQMIVPEPAKEPSDETPF